MYKVFRLWMLRLCKKKKEIVANVAKPSLGPADLPLTSCPRSDSPLTLPAVSPPLLTAPNTLPVCVCVCIVCHFRVFPALQYVALPGFSIHFICVCVNMACFVTLALKKKPLFKSEYFKMKHPLSIIWKLLLFIVKLFLVCRTANWSHFTATVCPFSSSLIVLSDFAALMASLLCQKAASLAVCLQSSHRNTHSLETVNTRLEMEMLQGSAIYSILIQWLLSNAY